MNCRITTHDLLEVGLERWFDCVPPPPDRDEAVANLAKALSLDGPRNQFRVVARSAGVTIGGIAARRDGKGRLTVWSPKLSSTASSVDPHSTMGALLGHVLSVASSDPTMRYVEAKPADDESTQATWRPILTERGFVETACAHVYELTPDEQFRTCTSDAHRDSHILAHDKVAPCDARRVFQTYQALTQDRADSDGLEPTERAFDDLLRLSRANEEPRNWLIYRDRDRVLGMVVLGVDPDAKSTDEEGWIYSIGTIPEARKNGHCDHFAPCRDLLDCLARAQTRPRPH